jgi:transcriptional regulator with PAS, ATPase and Fis domain
VQRHPSGDDRTLLTAVIEDLAGHALVLDAKLAIVSATAGAPELVGSAIPLGVSAPKLLCGGAVNRPIAEALAEGVPVTGTVIRPDRDGVARRLLVRATPIERGARRIGWVLLLDAERPGADDDAPVLFHGMWTLDAGMKHAFHIVERAAPREASVLLRGETGTGKELFARAIHALSPRSAGPFAAINCAALPATLLESELFGHVRGAFTGAVRDQPGFFKGADHGTAFLDEVAEMPLDLQAKLLRVLETKTVIPVGGRDAIPVDVRIVAATHQSLRAAVEAGRFRPDLMYRLRVIPIFIPPLRARPKDVALLAQKIIEELNRQGGRRVARLAPAALGALRAYPWPGNVRELRNALEYAFVIGEGPVLVPTDLPMEIVQPAREATEGAGAALVNAPPPSPEGELPEVTRIRRALERAAGNRERAAQMLGMSRVTLWRRMRAHGIAADD